VQLETSAVGDDGDARAPRHCRRSAALIGRPQPSSALHDRLPALIRASSMAALEITLVSCAATSGKRRSETESALDGHLIVTVDSTNSITSGLLPILKSASVMGWVISGQPFLVVRGPSSGGATPAGPALCCEQQSMERAGSRHSATLGDTRVTQQSRKQSVTAGSAHRG
jgi:hypothetical protein